MHIVGKDDKPKPRPNPSVNKNGALNQNIKLADTEEVKCEKCESIIFEEKLMIRKISKFITGSDRDSVMPIPIVVCSECNHINELLKPNI